MTIPVEELGAYFRQVRQTRGLFLAQVAEKGDSTSGTISRLETGRSRAGLLATYRICAGLELSLDDLCAALGVTGLMAQQSRVEESATELERFLELTIRDPDTARAQVSSLGKPAYPPGSADDIAALYRAGRAFTQFELGEFVRRARRERQYSLRAVSPQIGHSFTMLFRLEHGALPTRLMFDDLFRVGQALDVVEELLPMAWSVAEFYTGLRVNLTQVDWHLARLFILSKQQKGKGNSC